MPHYYGTAAMIPADVIDADALKALHSPRVWIVDLAGGFLGYLSTVVPLDNGRYSTEDLKRAVVHGNLIGSFACEDFSITRLASLTMDEVEVRYRKLVEYSHFDPTRRLS